MHIVITGGAGFIGKKLAAALLSKDGVDLPGSENKPLEKLTLFDVAAPEGLPDDPRLDIVTGSIADPNEVKSLVSGDVDVVYHLAAIVSANAEADFDLGMAVNLDGTRHVLEACRQLPAPPRVVFASSVAVYGGNMPDVGHDEMILNPQTSYGAQKAVGELMVNDYSRKGFIDGRALRLPTIVVRPGKPNKAASTFASSIIREPLAGEPRHLPRQPGIGDVHLIAAPGNRSPAPCACPSRRRFRSRPHADASRHFRSHRRGRGGACRCRRRRRR